MSGASKKGTASRGGGSSNGGKNAAPRRRAASVERIETLTRKSLDLVQSFEPTAYLLGGTGGSSSSSGGVGYRCRKPVVKKRKMLPPNADLLQAPSSSAATASRTTHSKKAKSSHLSPAAPEDAASSNYSGNYLYGIQVPAAPERDRCWSCQRTTEPPECKEDVLLCDGPGCGREYHFGCCVPTLLEIPEGSWLCQDCNPEGSTATLRAYFDRMKQLRSRSASRVQNLLGLILQDAEQVGIPKTEIPVSELERANVYHAAALQTPTTTSSSMTSPSRVNDAEEAATLRRLGRDFFLGKPLRLYDDLHDHFHTGRIVDYRRTYEDGITDLEYLVRFGAGSDDRKVSASYWIALEEHNLSIGTTIVQLRVRRPVSPPVVATDAGASPNADGADNTPKKRRGRPPSITTWVPAMVWLRSTRALLSLYGINPDFSIFASAKAAAEAAVAAAAAGSADDSAASSPAPVSKGKSPASSSKAKQKAAAANKRQLWAAACPFGSKEVIECDLVSQTTDFATAAVGDPDPKAGGGGEKAGGGGEKDSSSGGDDDRVRFLNWLAMAESQAQERVREWHAMPLRNQRHDLALTHRDEASLGPLVPVNCREAGQDDGYSANPATRLHAQLCPLVSPGLDRSRLLQIAMRHHPDSLDLSKDVASTLTCRIVSLSDMEAT